LPAIRSIHATSRARSSLPTGVEGVDPDQVGHLVRILTCPWFSLVHDKRPLV
jgi:hypothetical protein